MGVSAIIMMVVALAIIPGGLIASTIFLARRPELDGYPALPDGVSD
ncbi:MAG: methionine/alanine import family NSS transporter small subunit [Bifidobacteriaceae bacterium]|jgi:hypothetical protein|nr:methionine/alanine import family NSS transporter small subunit [Bifidobacteriaceae bacterium]